MGMPVEETQQPSPSPSAEIARLDPERDYERIVFLLSYQLFQWDVERSLEFALLNTYAIPSVSGLLARTGEFTRRARKRYDNTELLLAEIGEDGFGSDRGGQALDASTPCMAAFASPMTITSMCSRLSSSTRSTGWPNTDAAPSR